MHRDAIVVRQRQLEGPDAPLPSHALRLLVVDDLIPDPGLGFGYPRTFAVLSALRAAGFDVTYLPRHDASRREPCTSRLRLQGIDVAYASAGEAVDFSEFVASHRGEFAAVWISRRKNLEDLLPAVRRLMPNVPLVYDAECLTWRREILRRRAQGMPLSEDEAADALHREIELIRRADIVLAVSAVEREILAAHGIDALVVGHSVVPPIEPRGFPGRAGILFYAGFFRPAAFPEAVLTPNEDAFQSFARNVWPALHESLQCELTVAGFNSEGLERSANGHPGRVRFVGRVPDPGIVFGAHRVFVAPTRFCAGIPLKVLESLARGTPAIVSPPVAELLGGCDGAVLVGNGDSDFAEQVRRCYADEGLWTEVRRRGREYVERLDAPGVAKESLRSLHDRLLRDSRGADARKGTR